MMNYDDVEVEDSDRAEHYECRKCGYTPTYKELHQGSCDRCFRAKTTENNTKIEDWYELAKFIPPEHTPAVEFPKTKPTNKLYNEIVRPNCVVVYCGTFGFVEETRSTVNGQHTQVVPFQGEKLSQSQQAEAFLDCLANNPYVTLF